MPKPKPKLVPAWRAMPLIDRLAQCKSMLYMHGLLSEAENSRVQERLLKMVRKRT